MMPSRWSARPPAGPSTPSSVAAPVNAACPCPSADAGRSGRAASATCAAAPACVHAQSDLLGRQFLEEPQPQHRLVIVRQAHQGVGQAHGGLVLEGDLTGAGSLGRQTSLQGERRVIDAGLHVIE